MKCSSVVDDDIYRFRWRCRNKVIGEFIISSEDMCHTVLARKVLLCKKHAKELGVM